MNKPLLNENMDSKDQRIRSVNLTSLNISEFYRDISGLRNFLLQIFLFEYFELLLKWFLKTTSIKV